MRIGLKLSPQWVDFETLEGTWAAAGASKAFDSLWSFDHLYPIAGRGPCLEGWTSLAVLAHRSGSKTIGHLVMAVPYRNASLLAKMATVMDHATDGRFVLGLGAGWHVTEAGDFGLPMPGLAERMALLEASLRSIRQLWGAPDHAEGARPVTRQDQSFEVPSTAVFEPAPRTHGGPRIWIGTAGEQIGLRLVARYADGWNHSAAKGLDLDAFSRKLDVLRAHCGAIGRDPREVTVSVQLKAGTDEHTIRDTSAWAIRLADAGCDHLVLMAEAAGGERVVREAERVVATVRDAGK